MWRLGLNLFIAARAEVGSLCQYLRTWQSDILGYSRGMLSYLVKFSQTLMSLAMMNRAKVVVHLTSSESRMYTSIHAMFINAIIYDCCIYIWKASERCKYEVDTCEHA